VTGVADLITTAFFFLLRHAHLPIQDSHGQVPKTLDVRLFQDKNLYLYGGRLTIFFDFVHAGELAFKMIFPYEKALLSNTGSMDMILF
jgi:hypothetical protein